MALKEYEVLVPITGEVAVLVEAESAEAAVNLVLDEEIDWRENATMTGDIDIDTGYETYATEA